MYIFGLMDLFKSLKFYFILFKMKQTDFNYVCPLHNVEFWGLSILQHPSSWKQLHKFLTKFDA
jgi:hypothetical protein